MGFRLLPESRLGWTPYAWLVYLSLYIAYAVFNSESAADWAIDAAAVLTFLALYFRGFWLQGRALVATAFAIVALGVLLSPRNPGAASFFIYGAAFLGEAARPSVALRYILVIAGIVALEAWLVPLRPQAWIPALVFSVLIGGTNIHFAEVRRRDLALLAARDNAEHLAAVAERERIARDLHDLLGHTLSVIVIKAELASKLADRDPARAAAEIRDVERISRTALQEVRRAIQGYRGERVDDELSSGRAALAAAGVTLYADVPALGLDGDRERALALAIREAITNVIRHSGAQRCEIRAERDDEGVRIVIQDDGRGGTPSEGSGLSGMRERLAEVGGTLAREQRGGTRLTITVPALPLGAAPRMVAS